MDPSLLMASSPALEAGPPGASGTHAEASPSGGRGASCRAPWLAAKVPSGSMTAIPHQLHAGTVSYAVCAWCRRGAWCIRYVCPLSTGRRPDQRAQRVGVAAARRFGRAKVFRRRRRGVEAVEGSRRLGGPPRAHRAAAAAWGAEQRRRARLSRKASTAASLGPQHRAVRDRGAPPSGVHVQVDQRLGRHLWQRVDLGARSQPGEQWVGAVVGVERRRPRCRLCRKSAAWAAGYCSAAAKWLSGAPRPVPATRAARLDPGEVPDYYPGVGRGGCRRCGKLSAVTTRSSRPRRAWPQKGARFVVALLNASCSQSARLSVASPELGGTSSAPAQRVGGLHVRPQP